MVPENNALKFSYLKGNKYIIQRIINDFKEGNLDILLVNIHNYGSGLNLSLPSSVLEKLKSRATESWNPE